MVGRVSLPSPPVDDLASGPGSRSRVRLLGTEPDGRPLPDARRRLMPAVFKSEPLAGWLGPLAVTVLAGLLRLWNLGYPAKLLFDETYYAKDAYSLLTHGYVLDSVEDADKLVDAGRTSDLFTTTPSFYVHPDVGKWLIAVGEHVFGMNSLGWRISAALAGTITVFVLCRLVRRLTGSTLLGCVAGLLLCFDGLHFTMSRLALLDIFLTLFVVCAVACLLADRDWGRLRLARTVEVGRPPAGVFGPVRGLLFRPWRLAAGVCFGLACGSKWSGVFVLAAFGLLVWAWDSAARRAIGVRWPVLKSALVDAVPAFFSLVGVALVVYVASWGGWLAHAQQYEERFGHETGNEWGTYLTHDASGLGEVTQSLQSLWHYHQKIWDFHTGEGIKEATHTYQSNPWGWPILNRPVGIDAQTDIEPGTQGCPETADKCIRQVLAIGTPVLWWGGVLAMLGCLWWWIAGRDWRFGVAVVGLGVTWLPWLRFDQRPIFLFYAVAMIPFIVIGTTLVLGKLLGPPGRTRRRRWGAVAGGVFVALVIANFAWFWPIWTDGLLTNAEWLERIWFSRWI